MTTPETTDAAAETAALADRFFAAIEAGDIDTLRAVYAPDAVIWHNFDQVEQSRDDNLKTLAFIQRRVKGMRYTEVRRFVVDGGFIQQHVLRGDAPSGELVVPAMIRFHVTDGRVTRIEEYLDPRQADVLRAPATPAPLDG